MEMSVKVSLLKQAKEIVESYLRQNYIGEFDVFYSLGQDKNNFSDQYLRIQLDTNKKYFGAFAKKIRKILVAQNADYTSLNIKIIKKS